MSVLDILRARRSIRRWKPEAPPRAELEALIEAATTAPSASNRQPWRFVVVTRRETIDGLAAATDAAVARIAGRVDPRVAEEFRSYAGRFSGFRTAPALIVPLYKRSSLLHQFLGDDLALEDRAAVEAADRDGSLISASLAVENLLLAAHESGLGAVLMTGPLLATPDLRELLTVKPSWRILGIVAVGRPDESPPPTPRRPAPKVTRWIE